MKKRIFIAIIVMGFSGLVAEIILLRELLIVFSGNELSIGIILANWLILEAFGSFFFGRLAEKLKNPLEVFSIITFFFSLTLVIAIFLARILKRVIGVSIGETIGLVPMLYSSFLILLPVSILHGALFTLSCRIFSKFTGQDASTAGRVYVCETVGTIAGGVACTYLLIPYLNTFQASFWLALLNFIICLSIVVHRWKKGSFQKKIIALLSLFSLTAVYLVLSGQVSQLHHFSIREQWKNLNVVHYQDSRYGNICVSENEGQYIFFIDGIPTLLTPIPDIQFVEEFVHLPLLAHLEPEKLLVLSGGAGGVINEALKHPSIETIEYVELDPLLIDLLKKFPTPLTESELNDKRVVVKNLDGRLLLKQTKFKYDIILVGIMDPSGLQTNRFYTKEFFSLAKRRMNKEGILVIGLTGSLDYLNDELKNLNSCIFSTLKSEFSYLRVIPGDGKNLFLASDSREISTIDREQIIQRLNERNIHSTELVPRHIDQKLHQGWQDWFSTFLEGGSQKINSDFKPVGLFYSIAHWNSLFSPSLRWIFSKLERINLGSIVILLAVFLLMHFILRFTKASINPSGIPMTIVTTGFAGMIFDLMIIFAFQSMYGYVFSWIGLLVASFMAGATLGATLVTIMLGRVKNYYKLFLKIDLALIGFAFVCPLLFLALWTYLSNPGFSYILKVLFLVVSLFCGFLTASQFPLANKLYLKDSKSLSKTAGHLYAYDLLGGWLGGIIGAVVLLPVLGVAGTCVTVGLLKLTNFVTLVFQPNKHLRGVNNG